MKVDPNVQYQPAQESKRKSKQSEEEMDAVGGRGKSRNPEIFAKPAKISLNLRKFRRFSEIFHRFSENGKFR